METIINVLLVILLNFDKWMPHQSNVSAWIATLMMEVMNFVKIVCMIVKLVMVLVNVLHAIPP